MERNTLLQVLNLSISFGSTKTRVEVIHGISFEIKENEILGVVGESGSGKSVTSMALMGLLTKKTSHVTGKINFQGRNIVLEKEKRLQKIRGKDIAMIFQEPMSALNPSMKCGNQVCEILQHHLKLS